MAGHETVFRRKTNELYINKQTEKFLWYQRLGHPCDKYLYKAGKAIEGVPTFKSVSSILDTCPTCIRAKQTKAQKQTITVEHQVHKGHVSTPSDLHIAPSERNAQIKGCPSTSGMPSSNSEQRVHYEGINRETAWVLVTNHFTGMQHGDTRTSKAAPILWLKHFLAQYNPTCTDKYVYMDQGGELFNNPEIKNLFTKSGDRIHPTGADTSNQNGPVERAHRSIADTIRALLTGSGIDTKFWPYVFYRALWLHNAIPT